MGLYATTTAIATYLIGTTMDTATTSLVTKCITNAENEVDKYISERYDVSIWTASGDVPPLVTTWTEKLSLSEYYQFASRGSKDSLARGAQFRKQVIDNLTMIKEYKCNLVDSSGDDIAERTNNSYRVRSNTTSYTPTFDEGTPLQWTTDPDKLDDIQGAKS
jgi:hypothetical protein